MAGFALKALGVLMNRHSDKGDNTNATVAATKPPTSSLKKVRISLGLFLCLLFATWVLPFVLVFAGSKPGMLEEYNVFTLNVSRIGEGIHQDIDGAINGINLDALHIDLKRSVPLDVPVTITAPPTTLVTMAPRDVGSIFKSLTKGAGDDLDSADSAVHSKVSSVKSKASSAANAAESSVNSGIDSAAKKLKAKLTEAVNEAFTKMVSSLDLQDFYSVHAMTTCQGDYVDGKGDAAAEKKKVTACKKDSPLNPMKWVSIFYWAAIITTGIAFVLTGITICKPGGKWINWTVLFLGASFVFMLVASALTHGIADAAERLTNFVGNGISISGIAGQNFIRMTWTATILLFVETGILYGFKWYLGKHPEKTTKTSSKGMKPFALSPPSPSDRGGARSRQTHNAYPMTNMRTYENPGTPPSPPTAHSRSNPSPYPTARSGSVSTAGGRGGAYGHERRPRTPESAYDGRGPYRPGRESQAAEFI